ncbi:protein kinase 4-like [Drosophila serrata]|uniref:protein kinase 4-like n=1 Tax=Drosophila serrata TaxID=7274 RepID=UPI000A1D0B79|nr:protein kinase 4-like [Drosophila serrata]
MRKNDDKVLSKQDPVLQPPTTPPRQLFQPKGDGHIDLRQDHEPKAGTSEIRIKSESSLPFCEDLWDVLDELGEILDEELAESAFELKPEITPPPPSMCLDDDTSLFTRRSNYDNNRSSLNIEFIESGTTQIIESPDSNSHNKPKNSSSNAGQEGNPVTQRSSSKVKRAIEPNPQSPRPSSKERRSTNTRSKTGHNLRSKHIRSGFDSQRSSRSQSKQKKT